MFCTLFRVISFLLLTALLPSHSFGQQQYRQPTKEEIAGAKVLREQMAHFLQVPSNASWNQMYRAFFDQSRVAICDELRKQGLRGSCDWDTIQIILVATNDPEIRSQSSQNTIATLTTLKIIALKTSLATGCPLLSAQSSWEELLTCSMHQADNDRRKQLNFAPGTATEIVDYVWRKEKGSSGATPGTMPALSPGMPGRQRM